MRAQEEETREQRAQVEHARMVLRDALTALAGVAKRAARTLDLDDVRAAINRVDRAEEALDTASYDLHTAAGGDG